MGKSLILSPRSRNFATHLPYNSQENYWRATRSEKALKYVAKAGTWAELQTVTLNVQAQGEITDTVRSAIEERSDQFGVEYVLERTGHRYDELSVPEKKIVRAIGKYAALLHKQGKHPNRTLQQIRRLDLLGAAEAAVCKSQPSHGYQILAKAELEELSYEQIVLDYPDQFTPRALWYARRTRGLPTENEKPPASDNSDVSTRTMRFVQWLKSRTDANDGILRPFSNDESAAAIGLGSLQGLGRVHGNIQSRIDFACYLCDLPPLCCAALTPFERAWRQGDRLWAFPVAELQLAAQSYIWTTNDFERVNEHASSLPGVAYISWREGLIGDEKKIRAWPCGGHGQQRKLVKTTGILRVFRLRF
jgi:hypothetical protein